MTAIEGSLTVLRAGVTALPREVHAQDLKSWITVLKGDKRANFTAASQAQKAADYPAAFQTSWLQACRLIEAATGGVLVRLALSGALMKATDGEMTMLNQKRVRMKLELMERQQYSPSLQIVDVEH